jgi:N-acetyl-alpha-D-muramate 1-phosphate uridylyltransferase
MITPNVAPGESVAMPKAAMILAAGRGERMRPFTDEHPKPLARIGGKSLIEYHVDRLVAAGVTRVVINVAWLGSQIKDALGSGSRFGVEIVFSDEGATALDTGGGIYRALPALGPDPFWVVSADLWTEFPLTDPGSVLHPNDLAHLIMVPNPDFHLKGDFCLERGRVTETSGTRLTYGSIAILHPDLFVKCRPGVFSVVPLLIDAMRAGRVGGELFEGVWHNVGTLAQLQSLDRDARAARRD